MGVALFDGGVGVGGVGVFGGVGECLGHDEVGGHLDRVRGAGVGSDVEFHRERGAAGQAAQGRAEPALGQDRGVDAAGDLAQLLDRPGELVGDPTDLPVGLEQLRGDGGLGQA
ncbi:MAG: hypothetical protein V7646_822 [Pseudonocardia sp.]